MPAGDVWPEIVLLVTAVVIVIGVSFLPHHRHSFAAPAALAGLAAAAVGIAQQLGVARLTFSGVWALDGTGAAARLLIILAAAASVAMAPDWLRSDRRHGEFYATLLLSTLGAMLMAGAADTLQLVVAILLASVTGYTLAAYHRNWAVSVEAGLKFFLVGAIANGLMLVGIVLLFGLFGSTDYAAIAAAARDGPPAAALLLAIALVVTGIAFKIGALPVHAWVPDVAQGAPAPAAAFLTVAPKIGAIIALARFVQLFPADAVDWRALVATLAAATMTLGNLAALWQDDVRRLLGWSTVSQSGYALVGVTVLGLTPHALPSIMVFLLAYAVANLSAFAVVTELRGRTAIRAFRGLIGVQPAASMVLVLSLLSLAGVPPLAGFFGKVALFAAAIDGGYAWLAAVAMLNTVVSLFYYLRVIAPTCFARGDQPVAVLGTWSRWTMISGGVAVVVTGLGAEALFRLSRRLEMLPWIPQP